MNFFKDKLNHLMLKIFKEQNIKKFEKTLAWDNLVSLVAYSKFALIVILVFMAGRCLIYGFSVINTVPFLIEGAIIIFLLFGSKKVLKVIDKNSKHIVMHARFLTSIFSFSAFLLTMFYDIVVKPTNISVIMYIALLIISAMFDSYPHDYILFYTVCFATIVSFEFFFVPREIFITDTINTLFVILGGAYIITHRLIVKIDLLVKIEEEQNKELLDAKTKMILSQMQPHFLYNVLATIRVLYKKDQEKADNAMDDFSAYLRANIDNSIKKTYIPFSQELENIKHYLNLERLRYGDKLQVFYNIQDSSFYLPVLTLQPVVENAVKHGVGNKKGGGSIIISTLNENDRVLIKIEDNGVGIDADSIDDISINNDNRGHIGLISVKERIEVLLGGTMLFRSRKNEGTTVIIDVPKYVSEESINKFVGSHL